MNNYEDFDKYSSGAFPRSDCQKFGELDGCKSYCPVFQLGKCEVESEVKDMIRQEIIE